MLNIQFHASCTAMFWLLVMSLIAVKSAHPAESCPPMQYSIKIVDESGGKHLSGESLATLGDANFKSFVTSVSQHVVDKIGERVQCRENAEDVPDITLFFVYRPLIASKTAPVNFPIDSGSAKYEVMCRLDSPWVKLTMSRSPKLNLYAVFTWNERQILLDQALLAGADALHTEPAASLEEHVFEKYVQNYTDSVLLEPSSEAEAAALIRISGRIPADVLWLFRHAWQSTLAPFSMEARHALRLTLTRATPQYAMLTNALVDRCWVSAKVEERYHNIFELKGIFNISEYQIDNIH